MNNTTVGDTTVSYCLVRSARKTTAITVEPDQKITVRAPLDADAVSIDRIIRKRAAWIMRQQRFFAQFLPKTPARVFVSGETHLYLGRKYRLRVRPSEQEEVKLRGGYLYICTHQPADPEHIKGLLYGWYEAHAQLYLTICLDSPLGRSINTPELRIRPLAKRWGSCHFSGILTLNLDLIRAPRACIDYVILHELCHLRYPNHSPQFYELLTRVLPDWKATKLRLEQVLS
jgi:predicted metal-dependent hydrolase